MALQLELPYREIVALVQVHPELLPLEVVTEVLGSRLEVLKMGSSLEVAVEEPVLLVQAHLEPTARLKLLIRTLPN